ncbi:MAG: helix-turn-helix transcriptional regulator [Bacteroidia bacterium]
MLKESVHIVIAEERLKVLEDAIGHLTELIKGIQTDKQQAIGDWIDEDTFKKRTGIERSTLYKLRKAGKLSSSKLSPKKTFYRLSEIEMILNNNAINADR